MPCMFGCLNSIATIIVAVQFFAKVVPWFYEHLIGPLILGQKIKFREYGEWACKYNSNILSIDLKIEFVFVKQSEILVIRTFQSNSVDFKTYQYRRENSYHSSVMNCALRMPFRFLVIQE